MALPRQPFSWPLTGGIAKKNSPLIMAPGTFDRLDDVRQERTHEWRARHGYTQLAADALPSGNPVVKALPLATGGLLGFCRQTNGATSARLYAPSLGTASRWIQPTTVHQSTPSTWTRRPITGDVQSSTGAAPDAVSYAFGGGFQLSAWYSASAGTIRANVCVDGEGTVGPSVDTVFPFDGRPRCLYHAPSNKLLLFSSNPTTGVVAVSSWVNGLPVDSVVTVGSGGSTSSLAVDAYYYGGATVTVVYRTATNQVRFVEWNPSTNVAAASLTLAVSCNSSNSVLVLLPDPDSSGVRTFAVSNTTPELRAVRCDSAGAILSNDVADTVFPLQCGGMMYEAGAGWMLVYESSGIRINTKRGGVIGGAILLAGSNGIGARLDSNCWREPGTDLCRFVLGIHNNSTVGGLPVQHTYYEHAIEFVGGSVMAFKEPQARMLPLGAGPAPGVAMLPNVFRRSDGVFNVALLRLRRFSKSGSAITTQLEYALDRWQVTYASTTNAAAMNQGAGVLAGQTVLMPAGTLLHSCNGVLPCGHGASAIPTPLVTVGSTAAGALTLLATYGYVITVDMTDDAGNVWHGPPSIPATLTLTGTQNTITVTCSLTPFENTNRRRTVKLWRTQANGNVYRLVRTIDDYVANTVAFSFADGTADTAMLTADLMPYTVGTVPGELPNQLTPSFSHVATFGGRVWGIDREFPGILWFSKPLAPGNVPEFVPEFQLDIEEVTGEGTGIAGMDDKLVVFKQKAIYVIFGDGPDNTGGGQFPSLTRISNDIGAIPGPPVVSTGQEVVFVSARGIYMIDRNLTLTFVGADVDQYLNQPLVQAQATVYGGLFVAAANEVRFDTTAGRLVYDRLRGMWYRDTGATTGTGIVTTLVGTKQAIVMPNGDMFVEGTDATTDDGGTAYQGVIRSAWMRPAGTEGWLRLDEARLLGLRTQATVVGPAATPTLTIFFDNSETLFESATPRAPIPGAQAIVLASLVPRRQKCSAFALQTTLQAGDVTTRLDAWAVQIGIKTGLQKDGAGERWT